MNTINKTHTHTITKPCSSMPNMLRKLAFILVSTAIFGSTYFAEVANANAFNNDSELQSSRSSPVNYQDKPPKQLKGRNAKAANEAQQVTIEALNKLALTTSASAKPKKTREHVMAERKDKLGGKNSTIGKSSSQSVESGNYLEFGIYDASSRLFEDFDYDGFYQTFSVRFDADVYGQYTGERARVFADLYLRRDNGPWELYFTTEAFTIVDDTSDDEFEVLSTLDFGYRTGHYDVLIDLYEVGFSDVVATISSRDLESLYALPLESSDRDEYAVVEGYAPEVVIRAGGFSIFGLLILVCAIGLRFYNHNNCLSLFEDIVNQTTNCRPRLKPDNGSKLQ